MTHLGELLRDWLPTQRWYGAKGIAIDEVRVLVETRLPGHADVRVTVLEVLAADGGTERYQLLVGRRTGGLEQRLEHVLIGEVEGAIAYDAVHDHDAMASVLAMLASGGHVETLHFTNAGDIDTSWTSRVMGIDQSNTSVVFGDEVILKLFRRLQPGVNPDIEVTKALADGGSTHIPHPKAWYDGEIDGVTTTLGLLQVFMKGASDGWAMATASVRDLFAEGDLHADEVGGDFGAEAERLGATTAEVHALMAQSLPSRLAGAEEIQATARQLHERLDAALTVVPELAHYAEALHAVYDQVAARTAPVPVQRVHGDFHLGQVLRVQEGWVLLDFEGEPARPLAERTALMSPLRDVAGMLRSFDYAARHLLADWPDEPQMAYRATEWAQRNRESFCDGYARAAGRDPRDESSLLRAFELDKAVYEVVYETRHRPSWLPIPLGSIERLIGGAE